MILNSLSWKRALEWWICNCRDSRKHVIKPQSREKGFPGGTMVKNPRVNAGDTGDLGSVPGWGRFLGEGNGSPLQCSCLESPMDRGAWRAAVHGVTQSWAQLSDYSAPREKAPRPGIPHKPDRGAPSGLQPNGFTALPAHKTVLTSPPHSPWNQGSPCPLVIYYTACISQPLRLAPRLPGAPYGPMWWVSSSREERG